MNPQERRDFAWYLGGILLTTPVLAHLFYNMWLGGGYLLARYLTIVPFVPDGVTGVEALLSFGFGVYLGLLALYSNDYRKRYQGLLLLSGLVVLVGGLTIGGLGLGVTPLNAAALAAGVLLGVVVEAARSDALGLEGELRLVNFEKSSVGNAVRDDDEAAQFRVASLALVAVTVLAVVVGNGLYLVVSPPGLETYSFSAAYVVASLVFFYFLHGFITLDPTGESEGADPNTTSFEVMGPKQSGKTYFALALFLEVLNNEDKYDLEGRSKGIRSLVNEYNNAGEDLRWDIANTLPDEAVPLRFEFIARSRLNPSRIEVNMLDHPGEILPDVSENLSGERTVTDGGSPDEDEEESDEVTVPLPENATGDDDEIQANKVLDRRFSRDETDADEEGPGTEGETDAEADETARDEGDRSASDDGATSDVDTVEADASATNGDAEATTVEDTGSSVDADTSTVDSDTSTVDPDASTVDPDEEPDASAEEPSGDASEAASTAADAEGDESEDGEADEAEATDEDAGPTASVNREPVSAQDKVIKRVENNVKESDKLVFLLDSERFHGHVPPGASSANMHVEDFSDIVENVDIDDVVLVASKADFFIEEWQEEKGHQARPESSAKRFESFREYVAEQLLGDLQVKGLARMVNASTIHPVYFITEERDGELQPKPDKQGNIQPVGVENVLESIISS
ncbi:hypothetical protein [Haloparvum sedimenti]|uniref:hypothetical protein n=1 Tax=Haloparvum sedimenti TaxID=1678448 RepID=UPI00071E8254|nr:hypothetical protein [Haloparvum sedimenti]